MKNKLIFRILGALASALIIVAVFIPFVDVTGYSPSLWETYELTNSLYLPIMIIAFGAIGVIFFALNVKTEFAYMSVGAITFFIVIRTIDILDQGAFNSLSIGYYSLVIGTFLTGLMAFLTNLKSKKKVEVIEEIKKEEETSMSDQIDKLYNEQTNSESEISPIQPIDNLVQPLPIQPLEAVVPIEPLQSTEENVVEEIPLSPVVEDVSIENKEVPQESAVEQVQVENEQVLVNPVLQQFNVPTMEETKAEDAPTVGQQPVLETPVIQSSNPVLQEFSVPSNPVVEDTVITPEQPINPVLQEFAQATNPVLQEFGIESNNAIEQQPVVEEQPKLNQEVETVPLTNINEPVVPTVQEFNNSGFIVTPQQNSIELDIFGQPINKS